jgi:hypothetical protein
MWAVCAACVAAAVALLTVGPVYASSRDVTTPVHAVRVDAGGAAYTDGSGKRWSADCCNDGGFVSTTADAIAGTNDPTLYQSLRWNTGPFGYTFPNLVPDRYLVTLKFAETAGFGPGHREFNVTINGKQVLTDLDVAATVGLDTALDLTFPAIVGPGGTLTIEFTPGAAENPMVSAIQVISQAAADPSGELVPVGDMSADGLRWHQIYSDNFASEDVPLGARCTDPNGFPHGLSNWAAYPYPWTGTPSWATYCPARTTSIHDGVMDIWLHSETIAGRLKHLISAVLPRIPGNKTLNGQLYGRYVIRFREPRPFVGFHASWLLWPDTNRLRDGEIDFPEADTDSHAIGAFLHSQEKTASTAQYITRTPFYGPWHTAAIEWLPHRITFLLDGNVVGQQIDPAKIVNKPMHWVIQTNGAVGMQLPANAGQGHIFIDWVTIYARTQGA